MSELFLYDDDRARAFEPYALTRPAGELRAGAALVRQRWESALGVRAAGFVGAAHLADFSEPGAPGAVGDSLPAGALLASTRCIVPLGWGGREADVYICRGRVAAVRLAARLPLEALADGAAPLDSLSTSGTRTEEIPGRWIENVWELIVHLLAQLREDIAAVGPTLECAPVEPAIVIGTEPVYVERGATIEPLAVFDTTAGPVLVRRGAAVRAFTRVVGPCAIASGATVLADRVHGCSIGEGSVIRGEISESVVLGNANKGHEGFVGHSYLGRWVNLGAGTTTSNLKNTYGTVTLWTPRGVEDTGTLKLGTFFGDHVKTGIGLCLTTGSVVGAGANVYGSAMPPKYVLPFSWGEGDSLAEYRVDKFLEIAERAMARRQVTLDDGARRQLAAAHARGRGR
jgi:UDP-N-acetylglucosamine diphosphorylase / glucose-1-phosphate thymidylyltransferase / UDP-N-acetylgalactosamine diphosphorylase / glucosamine-1-phosphate N-acetyltransferase / galactosamine-1-phosphate N-acetyltransferase